MAVDGKEALRSAIRFDQGSHWRAKIGFVLLATEQTIQDDVMRLRPQGVGIHFTRAFIPDRIANDTLASQLGLLAEASATLLPDGTLDVVCYACTSGSIVMGEDRVHAELKRGNPNAKPTSLVAGVIKALRGLGAKSIAVATPYLDEINRLEARYLEEAGFNVVNIEGLNIERDSDMVRITPEYLAEFAQSVDRRSADCFFFSCGAMRSLGIVSELEEKLGKPVVVSNQAMIWDTWRMAGIRDQVGGFGNIMSEHRGMVNAELPEEIAAEAGQQRISTEEIHTTIRDRICLLEYAPGSLLREAALAVEFGVSRTPIREILQRLAQEGLVRSRNGVGTLVRPLDFDQIEDIYEMRLRIAPLIGELSPRPVLQTHVERAEDLLRRAQALASAFDLREYWNVNHDLHFVVGGLIGNVALAEMWDRFYFQAARMWYDLARSLGVEVARSLVREIEDTLEAMRSGDVLAVGFIQRTYIAYGLRQLRARHAAGPDGARLTRNDGDRPE